MEVRHDPHPASGGALTHDAFTRWLTRLGNAWEASDAATAAALFSEDVRYRESPFVAPLTSRADVERYWREMLDAQTAIRFSFEVLAVTPARATVNWRVRYHAVDEGTDALVDGVSVGRFRDGLCTEWLEWWHKQAGSG